MFEDIEDKDGHRWWLWVFITSETTVFVMDASRSADAAAGQLGIDREQSQLEAGRRLVISADFHKAYQSLARIDGVDSLWCWAHNRRYTGDRRSPSPSGRITLYTRVIIANFFGLICGDDHPCINRYERSAAGHARQLRRADRAVRHFLRDSW